jgi:hypothetical protein
MSAKPTVLLSANPNRHGLVRLLAYDHGTPDVTYVVTEPGDEDGAEFDGDLEAARKHYEECRKAWSETPNWDAQEEYDRGNR